MYRLDHETCLATGDCTRDVWVSPIALEDHGNGLGSMYISARFPAEAPSFSLTVLATAAASSPDFFAWAAPSGRRA